VLAHGQAGSAFESEVSAYDGEFRFHVIRVHTFFGCGPARVGRKTRVSRGAGRTRMTRFGL